MLELCRIQVGAKPDTLATLPPVPHLILNQTAGRWNNQVMEEGATYPILGGDYVAYAHVRHIAKPFVLVMYVIVTGGGLNRVETTYFPGEGSCQLQMWPSISDDPTTHLGYLRDPSWYTVRAGFDGDEM